MTISRLAACVLACGLAGATPLLADEHGIDPAATRGDTLITDALELAWATTTAVDEAAVSRSAGRTSLLQQARRRRASAGPSIGSVGLGAVAGLSDFEIGPSFRYWINDRFGVQAHLGFSGDDFGIEDVEYLRFEPTVIFAFGDFGDGSVNVRPYAGGGLRFIRTDIGDFNDSDVKPAGVGGVELGFQAVPRLKVSVELSVAAGNDFEDDVFRGPELGGARVAALAHYFFD